MHADASHSFFYISFSSHERISPEIHQDRIEPRHPLPPPPSSSPPLTLDPGPPNPPLPSKEIGLVLQHLLSSQEAGGFIREIWRPTLSAWGPRKGEVGRGGVEEVGWEGVYTKLNLIERQLEVVEAPPWAPHHPLPAQGTSRKEEKKNKNQQRSSLNSCPSTPAPPPLSPRLSSTLPLSPCSPLSLRTLMND